MMDAEIVKWLNEVRDKYPEQKVTLSLRNEGEGGGPPIPIDSWDLPAQLDASKLWDEIRTTAERDARTLSSTQRYGVYVLIGKDLIARRTFPVTPAYDAGMTHSASGVYGLVSMLMGHLERKETALFRAQEALMKGVVGENARLNERVRELEERDEKRAKLFEETQTQEHKRKMTELKTKHDMEMSQELVHGLRMIVPFAINRMMGAEVIPTKGLPSPSDQGIKALMESLSGDQLTKLQTILNPFQAQAVLQLWNEMCGTDNKKGQTPQLSAGGA